MESLYLFPPDDNPQKRCTGPCGQTLPATPEYFRRDGQKKDGLYPRCKYCTNSKFKYPPAPEGYKRCTGICERVLPATKEHFYSHGEKGLHAQCKECINAKERGKPLVKDIPEGYKKCLGPCGRELPTTSEYWYRNGRRKDGVSSRCKDCASAGAKERYDQPDVKSRRIAYQKDYYASNPEVKERIIARTKIRRQRPEVREKRCEEGKTYRSRPEIQKHYRAYRKEYSKQPEVQERRRIHQHHRRSLKKAVGGTYTSAQIRDRLRRQKHKCYYCQKRLQKIKGRYIYHIEHTFPLSRVAGTDIPANSIDYLVLACPHCNFSKGDKFPWEFPEGGRLF